VHFCGGASVERIAHENPPLRPATVSLNIEYMSGCGYLGSGSYRGEKLEVIELFGFEILPFPHKIREQMTTGAPLQVAQLIKDDPVLDLLMKEYFMLQDKIDKIGAFKFTIKGWAITLTTGAAVAAFATSVDPKFGIFLVLALLSAFWFLELRQDRLSEIFGDRALRIETVVESRLRSSGVKRSVFLSLIRVPGTATDLRVPPLHLRLLSPQQRRKLKRNRQIKALSNSRITEFFRAIYRSRLRRRILRLDAVFYLILLIVAGGFIYRYQSKDHKAEHKDPTAHPLRIMSLGDKPVPDTTGSNGGASCRKHDV
jgi:hypothetical protein